MKRTTLSFLAAPLLALLASCSSSDQSTADNGGSTPLYLAMTRVWDDTSTTSYLHVVPSLDEATEVDANQALEIPGAAKLFAAGELGWFAVGGGETPTITRYTLSEAGDLVEGESLSLQPFGVQSLWASLYFVSATKAYYPDTEGSQLIVWNPSKMEVTGTIELPETVREGFLSYYSLTPVKRGNKLLFSVGWFDWNTNDAVLPETGLVVLDTETDSVERFDVDRRCAGVTQAISTESGATYFVSSAMASAAHALGRLESTPCALRIGANEEAFDADYVAALPELTGETLVGEPAPGGGDKILLRALDPSAVDATEETQSWSYTGLAQWRWLSWDVKTDTVTSLDALPAATADASWFRIDGKVLASQTNSDYTQTQLVDVSDSERPAARITFPGFLQSVARVR